jgi:ATP-dependent helicase HepA
VFVRALEGEWASLGIGKQISRSGQRCSVEYFDAPVSEPIVLDLDTAAIEVVTLTFAPRLASVRRPVCGAFRLSPRAWILLFAVR